jgi:CBS-domain-containing membrane protein
MSRWKVKDVMTTDVVSVHEDAGFKELADLLVEHGVSAVPVVNDLNYVVGVVSEADLLHKVEFSGAPVAARLFERRRSRTAREKASGDDAYSIMTAPAVTTTPDKKVVDAARVMDARQVKRLPVVDEQGRLIGIVSRRDLLRTFLQPDAAIRDEVVEQVLRKVLWVEPTEVNVEVHDGVVTLTGALDRKSTVGVAVALTRGVDGVVDVVDELTYRYDDTADVKGSRYLTRP